MKDYAEFLSEFDELVHERARGRLSDKVLPFPENADLLYEITNAVPAEIFMVMFDSSARLVETMAGMRHQKLFEGKLDGEAVLSIVLAIFLLKHDAAARSCQRVMSAMDSDECLLVFESNEYLTLTTDPDPLQRVLFAFCQHPEVDHVPELARVIFGRCETYGSKPDILKLCHHFFHECVLLTEPLEDFQECVAPTAAGGVPVTAIQQQEIQLETSACRWRWWRRWRWRRRWGRRTWRNQEPNSVCDGVTYKQSRPRVCKRYAVWAVEPSN
jgi:hypothetical protein